MNLKILSFFIFIFFLIIFLNLPQIQDFFKNLFLTIIYPFQRIFWEFGTRTVSFLEKIEKFNSLEKENQSLRSQIEKLQASAILAETLQKENTALKEALNLKEQDKFDLEVAEVWAKNFSEDTIFINKGKMNSLQEGMVVILPSKILVGKIEKSFKNFSSVKLITAKGFSIPAKILGKEIFGLAKGQGNSKIFLERVPTKENVREGDIVYSVLSENFREGFLLGKVKKVKRTDVSPFLEIELENSFSIEKIDFVFIIKNHFQ